MAPICPHNSKVWRKLALRVSNVKISPTKFLKQIFLPIGRLSSSVLPSSFKPQIIITVLSFPRYLMGWRLQQIVFRYQKEMKFYWSMSNFLLMCTLGAKRRTKRLQKSLWLDRQQTIPIVERSGIKKY